MGRDRTAAAGSRQPDCRGRGRRTAGLGRQGAGRERHRRRARAARRFTSSSAARSRSASKTTAKGWTRRTRGWRSSGTPRARSGAPTISRRSARSGSAARRSRRSRRSRISCCARARAAQQSGTEIRVNGGTVASVVEVGAAEGTAVEVERPLLQPAGAPEVPEVGRRRVGAGVAHRDAAGAGVSGGRLHADQRRPRRCSQCPPAGSLRDRLYQLYGERDDLIEVERSAGGLRLTGYVAALAEQGPTRGPQNVFINRRIVKDRTIAHAIIDAYSPRRSRSAARKCTCSSRCRPTRVDVNVHPTKAEVRFREQSLVHEVVRRALMDALGQGGAPQLQLRPETASMTAQAPTPFRASWRAASFRTGGCPGVRGVPRDSPWTSRPASADDRADPDPATSGRSAT